MKSEPVSKLFLGAGKILLCTIGMWLNCVRHSPRVNLINNVPPCACSDRNLEVPT